MLRLAIVCFLLLVQTAVTETTVSTNIDFVESARLANILLLQRVEHKVLITDTTFNLVGDSRYHIFPFMEINFELPFDQYVKFKYSLQLVTSNPSYFLTQVHIDNKEEIELRGHFGSSNNPSLFRTGQVFMNAGKHRAAIYYGVPNSIATNDPSWDWTVYLFKVEYFKKAEQ